MPTPSKRPMAEASEPENPAENNQEPALAAPDLVEIYIDPKLTEGGLTTNGRRIVGFVKVPKHEAEDIARRLKEIQAVQNFERDPNNTFLYPQNHEVLASKFLADPRMFGKKPGFTKELGMLTQQEWDCFSAVYQEKLKAERLALYNY